MLKHMIALIISTTVAMKHASVSFVFYQDDFYIKLTKKGVMYLFPV